MCGLRKKLFLEHDACSTVFLMSISLVTINDNVMRSSVEERINIVYSSSSTRLDGVYHRNTHIPVYIEEIDR